MKRKAEIIIINKYSESFGRLGLDGESIFVHGATDSSDKTLVDFVTKYAGWMLSNAKGECDITIHINNPEYVLLDGEEVKDRRHEGV